MIRTFFGRSMHRHFLFLVVVCVTANAAAPQPPPIMGRSWLVGDLSSNQILAAEKPDERFEPASLTKLMTAYLVFAAGRDKKLSPDQQARLSERAWRGPASRMFIQPGRPGPEDELHHGIG